MELIHQVSLECGYGIVLYTGSPDFERTLGGLVEIDRKIDQRLRSATARRTLPAWRAACHGCPLISETSGERFHRYSIACRRHRWRIRRFHETDPAVAREHTRIHIAGAVAEWVPQAARDSRASEFSSLQSFGFTTSTLAEDAAARQRALDQIQLVRTSPEEEEEGLHVRDTSVSVPNSKRSCSARWQERARRRRRRRRSR